jgi:hypothetical protein
MTARLAFDVRASWKLKSSKSVHPLSGIYIMEYITRMRLKTLGFTDNLDDLDCITAEALLVIDGAVEQLKADEMKKAAKKKG